MTQTSTDAADFVREWGWYHAGRQPLGWLMRSDPRLPWVRFHALPGSKRYSETAAERGTILYRANMLGDRLLGRDTPCWVIEARADEIAGAGQLAARYAEDDDPEGTRWCFYVRPVAWAAGAFDAELTAVADDGPAYVVWMSRADGALLAPYAGGFDLFPATLAEVGALRAEWPGWLSERDDGL